MNQIIFSFNKIQNKRHVFFGLLAISFYIIHASYLIFNNESAHIMWACHIASLAIGFGLIFDMPILIAIGVLWLGFGDIMWVIYLAGGGGFELTSPLTHIGGIAVGIWGLYRTCIPKNSWIWALIALLLLQQLSRWVTPEPFNINLAFRVHEGWENVFPTYSIYLAVLLIIASAIFLGFEVLLNRLIAWKKR